MNVKFNIQHPLTSEQHSLYLRLFYQLTLNRPFVKLFLALLYPCAALFFYYWWEQFQLFHPEWAAPILCLIVTPLIVLLFTLMLLPSPRTAIYARFNQKAFTDYPMRFILTDSDLRIFPLAFNANFLPPPLPYEKIAALFESDDAFYLLNPIQAGNTPVDTVIPKCALTDNSISEFRTFIEGKTHLTFQPLTEISALPALPVKSLSFIPSAYPPSAAVSDYVREDSAVFSFAHPITHEQHRLHVYLTQRRHRTAWHFAGICFGVLYLLWCVWMLMQGVSAAIGMIIILILSLLLRIFDVQTAFSISSMNYKERYEDAPVRYDLNKYTLCITFSGRGDALIHLTYGDISDLIETDEALHLLTYNKSNAIIVLPKSALSTEELNKLKDFLTESTGKTFLNA